LHKGEQMVKYDIRLEVEVCSGPWSLTN